MVAAAMQLTSTGQCLQLPSSVEYCAQLCMHLRWRAHLRSMQGLQLAAAVQHMCAPRMWCGTCSCRPAGMTHLVCCGKTCVESLYAAPAGYLLAMLLLHAACQHTIYSKPAG